MPYSQDRIALKHYGKYVGRMIRTLAGERRPETVARTVDNLARYMRTKSYEYNQEHPNNEVIIKDIKRMSGGGIVIDEVALNNLRSDYKQHLPARPQKTSSVRSSVLSRRTATRIPIRTPGSTSTAIRKTDRGTIRRSNFRFTGKYLLLHT